MTLDLAALIKAAQAIPTVTIPPGVYPAQVLHAAVPPSMVRIIATGVTFAGLQLSDCSNLSFEGLTVLQAVVAQGSPAVKLQNCVNVAFVNPTFTGTPDPATGFYMGKAVQAIGGSHVSITGAEISGFFKGVNPASSDDFMLSGSDLHHIRTSPVDGFGQRITITGNHIHDIIPVAGADHSDGLHFFTKGQSVPCDGLTITGNRMEMGGTSASGTLGINIEGTAASPFTNLKISGNALAWNNNQGITTDHAESGEISGNVLIPAAGLDNPAHAPAIVLRPTNGAGLKVFGNTSKSGPSMQPFAAQNTFLTPAQIAQYGAKA